MIKDYKIIKELGYGFSGTIYLVEKNGKKYALKIQHIFEEDMKPNIKSPIWREIQFSKKFTSKYPKQFVQLVDYFTIKNCNHKQKYPLEVHKDFSNYVKKRNSSPYCSIKIYTLVDNTLDKLNLGLKEYYSIFLQVLYAVYLMNLNNYVHADIHLGNVGIIKTDNKFIKVFGIEIPTYGNQVQILDNDTILHRDYELNKNSKIFYDIGLKKELLWTMMNLSFFKGIIKNNESLFEKFKGSDDDNKLREYSNSEKERFEIYQLMNANKKKNLRVKFYLPLEDILFIIKNKKSLRKIIDYIANKISN